MGDRGSMDTLIAEGVRLVEALNEASVTARLAGGVAIGFRCPSAQSEPLRREYADIDLVASSSQRKALSQGLVALGYEPNGPFNAVHGATRMSFDQPHRQVKLDVFLDRFEMCHKIDLRERLNMDRITLSAADLLLTKLQVFETNRKDLLDIVALVHDFPVTSDDSGLSRPYLQRVTAADWGLWRTAMLVIERTRAFVEVLTLPGGGSRADATLVELGAALESAEKTRSWQWRARVGERIRWYELPEETG